MPKYTGVYVDGKGAWYFKVHLGTDPDTGRRVQITRRGYSSASAAAEARSRYLEQSRQLGPVERPNLTVNQLLDLYLEAMRDEDRLAEKTLFDYAHYADHYVRPRIGTRKVRELDAASIAEWQRGLATSGSVKSGRGLAPNTIRLARAPLAGAFKYGLQTGLVTTNPTVGVPRPPAPRSHQRRHWSPEQAREFLTATAEDRLWPLWAFMLGTGVRVGEVIALRWASVDFDRRVVRIVDFASTLGYDLLPSTGKSREATRAIDVDSGTISALRRQRVLQAKEELAHGAYTNSGLVFTKEDGTGYHPGWISRQLARRSEQLDLPRLTAHGLRHTSATLMLANGVQPKVAAERLGHADPNLFMQLYSHVTPTMQRGAADALGRALFGEQEVGN